LVAYTIKSALDSKLLTKVMLSSDDDDIIEIAKKSGIEVPFKRPEDLASDQAKSIDVVKHVLDYYYTNGEKFDAICLLQPTYPFRPKGFIDKAIAKFISKPEYDSLISVLAVPDEFNPHWIFRENIKEQLELFLGDKEIISRRQDLPRAYYRDGALYLTKSEVIFNKESFYGENIGFVETDYKYYCNIDTLEYWKIAVKKEQILGAY
jgi:CMP-N-acetylneuraminic acid synthetase